MNGVERKGRSEDFDPRRALGAVAGVAGVGAAILGAHLVWGVGVVCPLHALTGVQCPFCGTTRAAAALLRGRWREAWGLNAWTMALGVVLVVCAVAWVIEILGGPALRPPRRWRPVTQGRVYWVVGVSGVAFMVIRNLV